MIEQPMPALLSLVSEVLSLPIPYRSQTRSAADQGYYLVCDYKPIRKGTVLVYCRPQDLNVIIYGYLPQASAQEKASLNGLLAQHVLEGGALNAEALENSDLRVCDEAEGIQRLIEVQQLLGVQWAHPHRLALH